MHKTIQQAGQALFAARQAANEQVKHQTEKLLATIASQPFGTEADKAYAQLRAVARIASELQSIEEQLRAVYQTAGQVQAEEEILVLKALPTHVKPQRTADAAVDDAKEVAPVKMRRKGRETSKGDKISATPSNEPRSNEAKVLGVLQQKLNRRSWTVLSQTAIAHQAGIPQGSIGATLRKLSASGRLLVGERGKYRLA